MSLSRHGLRENIALINAVLRHGECAIKKSRKTLRPEPVQTVRIAGINLLSVTGDRFIAKYPVVCRIGSR